MEIYKKIIESTTFGIQSHLSSAVVDGTRLKELQDNQKELDQRASYLLDKEKVTLATKNFEGRAATWFLNFSSRYDSVSWEQFVECNREAYSEAYFVAYFLSGLSDELRDVVLMFNPTTLEQAVKMGKSQIIKLEAITQKTKRADQAYNQSWTNSYSKEVTSSPSSLPQTLIDEPSCLQSFSTIEDGPRPKGFKDGVQIPINTIQGETKSHNNNWVNVASKMLEEEKLAYVQPLITLENDHILKVQLSLNTTKGEDNLTTLKFSGNFGGGQLQILVDNGSTLNSIIEANAMTLGWNAIILGGDWPRACTAMELDYEKMTKPTPQDNTKLDKLSRAQYNQRDFQVVSYVTPFWIQEVLYSYHRDKHFEEIMSSKTYDPISYPDFTLTGGILRFKGRVVVGVTKELKTCRGVDELLIEKWKVTLNTLIGDDIITTRRFNGSEDGHNLEIMIESGTTVIFIKEDITKKLGCESEEATSLLIQITSDQRLISFSEKVGDKILRGMILRGGYSVVNGTYMRLMGIFFWPGRKEDVEKLVRSYDLCKLNKLNQGPTQELLHPLLILELQGSHICKDFVEGLTKSGALNTDQVEEKMKIQDRSTMLHELNPNLQRVQSYINVHANEFMIERAFEIGETIYLKLQPFRQNSISVRRDLQLVSWYYSTYKILEKVCEVSYRLELTKGSKVHPIFHFSLPK
ncbi:hypothetical protein C2S52_007534 [Perilla frutescens var. hirtella]|nr:hypothetical protein C2S52_007534 [Perilla frutescens var. hirtella]